MFLLCLLAVIACRWLTPWFTYFAPWFWIVNRKCVLDAFISFRICNIAETENASKFAELLGEVDVPDTKKNLRVRVDAEYGATDGKLKLAKKAKELGLDAIHDTVHEMCKDEARHGKALKGLLDRYFGK